MSPTPFDLTGRCAVVTGASSGIGRAIAGALARAGADVVGMSLDEAPATTAEVQAHGRRALMLVGDTALPDDVERLADAALETFGRLDVWVNNAARLLVKPFLDTTADDWRDLLGSNLFGYVWGCRAAARRMAGRAGGGRIINISSAADVQPLADLSAYVAAKGGVVGLTRTLAVELAPLGITVNALAPGAIDTPLNRQSYTPAVRANYAARIPLGHIGTPEEIADVAVFLASDAARYVTGQELLADGGLTLNGSVGHART